MCYNGRLYKKTISWRAPRAHHTVIHSAWWKYLISNIIRDKNQQIRNFYFILWSYYFETEKGEYFSLSHSNFLTEKLFFLFSKNDNNFYILFSDFKTKLFRDRKLSLGS